MAKSEIQQMLAEAVGNDKELQQFAQEYDERLNTALALAELRAEIGLSQRELAEKVGKPQSTIARIESGAMNPSFRVLNDIAQSVGRKLTVSFSK